MSPLPANALPYGLRDVKLTPYNAAGVLGTPVDLPASRTLSYTDSEDFEELRGDDEVQAERGSGPGISWDLESGGISLPAYAVIAGGTTVASGVTPSQTVTYTKNKADVRPYFKIEGQSIADNIGDVHIVFLRARATGDVGGEFGDGSFFLTSGSGKAYPDVTTGDLYTIVHNEEETDIA